MIERCRGRNREHGDAERRDSPSHNELAHRMPPFWVGTLRAPTLIQQWSVGQDGWQEMNPSTISTFSCDIAYSESPAASRASVAGLDEPLDPASPCRRET